MLETTRIQGDELYADKWDFGTGLFNTLEFHAQYEPTGRCLMVVQRDDYTRVRTRDRGRAQGAAYAFALSVAVYRGVYGLRRDPRGRAMSLSGEKGSWIRVRGHPTFT